jgi:large subunit ribosomal protein L21
MEYVVLKTGGKQYRVSTGDVIEVDRLIQDKDKEFVFEDVLLFVSGDTIKIGKPRLSDVVVKAKVIDHIKGEKVRVSKFKAKVRYRKTIGFRPYLSKVKIEKIEAKKAKST